MDSNQTLLLGRLALETGRITAAQLAEASELLGREPDRLLGDVLLERGWITPREREQLEAAVAEKLADHQGDATEALKTFPTDSQSGAPSGVDEHVLDATVDEPVAKP